MLSKNHVQYITIPIPWFFPFVGIVYITIGVNQNSRIIHGSLERTKENAIWSFIMTEAG